MKRIVIIVLFTLPVCLTAFSQTERGSKLVGAQVGNLTFPTTTKGSIIGFQPVVGWFVADGLAVGAGIPFFSVRNNGFGGTQIGITPLLRYYIGKTNVKPFVGASAGVINTSYSGRGSGNLSPSTDGIYSVSGGLAFFINRSVSFDLGLTYTGGETVALNSVFNPANSLTPAIPRSINVNLGFQVYFGRN